MRISPSRLPRLLEVLVIAFAQYEERPLLGAVELFRGLSMQLAYRWVTGRVVAGTDERAVLLWSVAYRCEARRSLLREALGLLTATAVGLVLVAVTSAILLLPVSLALVFTGEHAKIIVGVGLAIVILRWLMASWRAVRSYRNELEVTARLPEPEVLRWRIDYLAAQPDRSGHGGRLLDAFLARADDAMAEVVLHSHRRNVGFYRHHGFRESDAAHPGTQRVMLRRLPGVRHGHRVGSTSKIEPRALAHSPMARTGSGGVARGSSSAKRWRTRRSISSTIGRTSSTDFPAGSRSSQST